jgi:hypothetical protein
MHKLMLVAHISSLDRWLDQFFWPRQETPTLYHTFIDGSPLMTDFGLSNVMRDGNFIETSSGRWLGYSR